jgi:hypothetical protein
MEVVISLVEISAECALVEGVMSRLWRFLKQKSNREIFGWIGGGVVVLATGLWAVLIYFLPAQTRGARDSAVQASCASVAIGGNVSGGNISAGTATNSDCQKAK